MNLSFFIAKRYLFSKKNRNAINIISGISVAVVAVATAALIIIVSFLNGFDNLIKQNINIYSPDILITPVKGKTFSIESDEFQKIKNLQSVSYFVEVMEENVLLKSNNKQILAVIKGVGKDYIRINRLDSCLIEGELILENKVHNFAVFGIGVSYNLGVSLISQAPVTVWIPDRKKININNPQESFNVLQIIPTGIISVEVNFDERYVLTSINSVRKLTKRDSMIVSSIEIKINKKNEIEETKNKIKNILGNSFLVKDVNEQHSDIYRVVKSEKRATFFILLFIVLIASFSMVASLTMLIIEKFEDIKTLHSMGANKKLINKIFISEGRMIALLGAVIGLIIGFSVTYAQQVFGFIRFPSEGNFIISEYPIQLQLLDFIYTFFAVNIIGFIITLYPVVVMRKKLFRIK